VRDSLVRTESPLDFLAIQPKATNAMSKEILLSIVVVVALAGAAHAQTADSLCANQNNPNLTVVQQAGARIECASPRLKANLARNITAALQFFAKLPAGDRAELAARLKMRSEEHLAYCKVVDHPQLPPSPEMEICLAYWQDWTYAEIQRGEQLVAQAQGAQAFRGFLSGASDFMKGYSRGGRQPAPPRPSITCMNLGSGIITCN
jgi:hypothetical protein